MGSWSQNRSTRPLGSRPWLAEKLDDLFITTFKNPTVAVETTQSNQTYTYTQPNQSYGDVTDERNLSPDWNPNYFYKQEKGLTYFSTDELEWTLLYPSRIEELGETPDQSLNETTTQVNDYVPTSKARYMKAVRSVQSQQLQSNSGKVQPYRSWGYGSTGFADR